MLLHPPEEEEEEEEGWRRILRPADQLSSGFSPQLGSVLDPGEHILDRKPQETGAAPGPARFGPVRDVGADLTEAAEQFCSEGDLDSAGIRVSKAGMVPVHSGVMLQTEPGQNRGRTVRCQLGLCSSAQVWFQVWSCSLTGSGSWTSDRSLFGPQCPRRDKTT